MSQTTRIRKQRSVRSFLKRRTLAQTLGFPANMKLLTRSLTDRQIDARVQRSLRSVGVKVTE